MLYKINPQINKDCLISKYFIILSRKSLKYLCHQLEIIYLNMDDLFNYLRSILKYSVNKFSCLKYSKQFGLSPFVFFTQICASYFTNNSNCNPSITPFVYDTRSSVDFFRKQTVGIEFLYRFKPLIPRSYLAYIISICLFYVPLFIVLWQVWRQLAGTTVKWVMGGEMRILLVRSLVHAPQLCCTNYASGANLIALHFIFAPHSQSMSLVSLRFSQTIICGNSPVLLMWRTCLLSTRWIGISIVNNSQFFYFAWLLFL